MLSLLWLTENYPPQRGGMSQSCDRIIHGLRSVGYEIEIIHFVSKTSGNAQRKQQQFGGYKAINFEDSESHTLNLAWNYIERLDNFDYIVCFGGYLPMIAAPIYSKWKGIRLVTFLRGNDFDTSIFIPRKRNILEDTLGQSEIVFSVSNHKLQKAKKWLPDINIHYVPNGIEKTDWVATQSEIEFASKWIASNGKGHLVLGIFGQLKAKKGVQFLLNALRKTSFTTQLHLLFIGDVEASLLTQIQASAYSYNLISFQDRYELLKYYLCCEAILIPSFYDGMPNVLLEAGALGIPVIGAAVDGMADVIEHGEDGFLFRAGDENDCRKVLYDFVELSKSRREEIGVAIKTKIFNYYTAENETKNYQQLLG